MMEVSLTTKPFQGDIYQPQQCEIIMERYKEYKDSGVKWDIPMHNGLNMNVLDGNGVKGQKHEQCCMAFALTGRTYPPSITQGVALG